MTHPERALTPCCSTLLEEAVMGVSIERGTEVLPRPAVRRCTELARWAPHLRVVRCHINDMTERKRLVKEVSPSILLRICLSTCLLTCCFIN